ncbi:MAG: zf-HC2 domain-containing protein [Candidatus Eremiobacterota bacterium]
MAGICEDVSEKMMKYIDGLAGEQDKKEVDEHLKKCKDCQEEFQLLQKVSFNMKSLSLLNKTCPPPELLVRFSEQDVTFNEGKEVRSHLESCSSCRDEVTLLFELNQELSLEPFAEIYKKETIPACLKSLFEETYYPPQKIARNWKFGDFLSSLFGKKKLVSAMATCSIAIFMALNGVFQFEPNFLSSKRQDMSVQQAPSGAIISNSDFAKKENASLFADESVSGGNVSGESKTLRSNELYAQRAPGLSPLEYNISLMEGIKNVSVSSGNKEISVQVDLEPSYSVTSAQICSIIALVAKDMHVTSERIVVYDNRGLVLSDNIKEQQRKDYADLTEQQKLEQHNFEEILTRNAQNVLDKELGAGKAVVFVNSNINFTVNEPLSIPGRTVVVNEGDKGYAMAPALEEEKSNIADNTIASDKKDRDSSYKSKDLSGRKDLNVTVYPPGTVNKLDVQVTLNNTQYDPESVKNIVSSTVGLEQGRDKITLVNRNFKNVAEAGVSNINPPVETSVINVPVQTSASVAEHSHTKFFGIVSLILAAIFLVISVRIITGKKITD